MQEAIIGLDIGTTCTKAVLFDLAGTELASAECAYAVSAPQPGWVEQDPEAVWTAVIQTLKAIVDGTRGAAHPLALAVACQSGSLVPLHADGTSSYPSITWMDGRSETVLEDWGATDIDRLVRQITGWHIHPGLPLATLAWLRTHLPGIFHATDRWLCMYEYVVSRLTGQYVTNPSTAGVTQLMDVDSAAWSPVLCSLAGIRVEQLSTIDKSGRLIGPLTADVSRTAGLPAHLPVINGGHDQACTALALGVTQPGQTVLACGTSWVVTTVIDGLDNPSMPDKLDFNPSSISGRWTASQSLGGLGAVLEWLVGQCWQDVPARAERFATLDRELRDVRLGEGPLFLPVTGGHVTPAGNQQGGFLDLQLNHTRAHLAHAVMEGAGYELRLALQEMQDTGMRVHRLWMVGGATRSSTWPPLLANITGLPIRVTSSAHLPAVGAAMLAGWGIGAFLTLADAIAHFGQPVHTCVPDAGIHATIEARFAAYRNACRRL